MNIKHFSHDRIFAIMFLLFFTFCIIETYMLKVAFSPDPLGPKAFPYIVSILGVISAVFLFIFPSENKENFIEGDKRKLLTIGCLLLSYALVFEPLGFMISTFFITSFVSMMLKIKPLWALIYAAILSVGGYYFFTEILQLNLPLGLIIENIFG